MVRGYFFLRFVRVLNFVVLTIFETGSRESRSRLPKRSPREIHKNVEDKVRGSLNHIILKKSDSYSSCCLHEINAREEDVDPNFVLNKTRKSPCKESPRAVSPASSIELPRTSQKTKGALKKKVPNSQRTNTARSFDEKEQVSKYKVSKKTNVYSLRRGSGDSH
jgi:hypothetical protein